MLLAELGGGLSFTIRQPTHVETDGLLPKEGEKAVFALHPEHAVVVPRGGAARPGLA